jgi:hypothetical protein
MKKSASSNTRKIAMQYQHLSKNTLFGYGAPKLQACTHHWEGETTVVIKRKQGGMRLPLNKSVNTL